jgi:hypothetical protein
VRKALPVNAGTGVGARRLDLVFLRVDKGCGSGLDSREPRSPMIKPRDIYEPDLHIDTIR